MIAVAGKRGRSGRKGPRARENDELLNELRDALDDEPPPGAVEGWKRVVRKAVADKKKRDS